MTTSLLALLGWLLLISGALPKAGRLWLEERLPFWDERWATVVSAVLEAALGATLLRGLLIETGIRNAPPASGMAAGLVGAFLAIEGVTRAVAAFVQGTGVSSLPILAVWRLLAAIGARSRG